MTPTAHQAAHDRAMLVAFQTRRATDSLESSCKAYLQALLDDAGVHKAVANGIMNHRGEMVSNREEACREMTKAAIDAIKAVAGINNTPEKI